MIAEIPSGPCSGPGQELDPNSVFEGSWHASMARWQFWIGNGLFSFHLDTQNNWECMETCQFHQIDFQSDAFLAESAKFCVLRRYWMI